MSEQQGYWQQDDKPAVRNVLLMIGAIAVIMTGVAIGIGLVL